MRARRPAVRVANCRRARKGALARVAGFDGPCFIRALARHPSRGNVSAVEAEPRLLPRQAQQAKVRGAPRAHSSWPTSRVYRWRGEQSQGPFRRETLVGTDHQPRGSPTRNRRPHRRPRVRLAKRRIRARAQRNASLQEASPPIQELPIPSLHIQHIAVAALRDEVRLRHHRDPSLRQQPQPGLIRHRRVLDAVLLPRSRLHQRHKRKHQLRTRHTMKRHWSTSLMGSRNPPHKLVDVRQRRIVQHYLEMPRCQRLVAHRNHMLVRRQLVDAPRRSGVVGRSGVCNPGNSPSRQLLRHRGSRHRQVRIPKPCPQPLIPTKEPPVVTRIQPHQPQRLTIQEPHLPGAMLNANGPRRHQRIEHPPIQFSGHRLVIADPPNPPQGP